MKKRKRSVRAGLYSGMQDAMRCSYSGKWYFILSDKLWEGSEDDTLFDLEASLTHWLQRLLVYYAKT